jgi:hypothetical protein
MRELHGVVVAPTNNLPSLKRHALLFDKLHLLRRVRNSGEPAFEYIIAELAYLQSRSFLHELTMEEAFESIVKAGEVSYEVRGPWDVDDSNAVARHISIGINSSLHVNTVPIYKDRFTALSSPASVNQPPQTCSQTVIRCAIRALPTPSDACSWEDILDFKAHLRDKEWDFRMFLSDLCTKDQSEAEIDERIMYTIRQYERAMELHHLKASQSFVDVFVISPLEIIENVVKFNWSKIANGALSVEKRKVELMEAEMKAPGKECAYIFDARKRFGQC